MERREQLLTVFEKVTGMRRLENFPEGRSVRIPRQVRQAGIIAAIGAGSAVRETRRPPVDFNPVYVVAELPVNEKAQRLSHEWRVKYDEQLSQLTGQQEIGALNPLGFVNVGLTDIYSFQVGPLIRIETLTVFTYRRKVGEEVRDNLKSFLGRYQQRARRSHPMKI